MLLKYQRKFLNNEEPNKVWRKGRQIGATWCLAGDACTVSGRSSKPLNTWFSSVNAEAGKLFIQDVGDWALKFDNLIKQYSLEERLIDEAKGIKATVVDFNSGKGVYALSSSPNNFRGKRGNVILDEFAFHENQKELWKAASSVRTWGGGITALSTVGNETDFFEELCEKAKKTKSWYFQQTTLEDAIGDGLLEAIWQVQGLTKKPTAKDKTKYIQEIRDNYVDEESFLQEYMCIPASSEATQWLGWDLITGVESRDVAVDGSMYKGGLTVIGNDIAIRKDKWVAVVFEIVGDVAVLVDLKIVTKTMRNGRLVPVTFEEKEEIMADLVRKYRPTRIYVDQTSIGENPVERYKKRFGDAKVEGVIFNLASMEDMAVNAKQKFEDKRLRLPWNHEHIRSDLRLIKKEIGIGNKLRFSTGRDKNGHGDIAWAIFLALLGTKTKFAPFKYTPAINKNRMRIKKHKGVF